VLGFSDVTDETESAARDRPNESLLRAALADGTPRGADPARERIVGNDWGKLLGDTAAVTALLDRLLHHAHVLKCGPAQLADEAANGFARG
jgi:IstB-like ATP binding protein